MQQPSYDKTRVTLLQKIRDPQNVRAWEEFDAIYRPMLHRFALTAGLDHATAEDVVQQSLASVQRVISGFEYDPSKGRFKSWLRTLVNNRVRSLRGRQRDRSAEDQDFETMQEREPLPEDAFENIWMEEHLKYCLRQVRAEVTPETYEAFEMCVLQERPVREICKQLDITPNNLYKIKWRLTQKLQDKMDQLLSGLE